MQSKRWAVAALLAAGLVSPWVVQAQSPRSGTLTGIVVDAAGAPVSGADVTVHSGQAIAVHATTGSRGRFSFSGVSQGYVVDITAPGFQPLVAATIPFKAGSLTHFTLQLDASGQVPVPSLVESPVRAQANRMPLEFGAFFQGGVGVTEQRSSFRFLLAGAHVGKVLTPEIGTGLFRGNFEYAAELIPYWQSFTPRFQRIKCPSTNGVLPVDPSTCSGPYTVGGTFTGVSVTPIILRWNFTHGHRLMPWVQGAGGLLWTNHKYPGYGDTNPQDLNETGPNADTSVFNFTPQFGVGTHIFVKPRRSIDFSANAVHISSASLGDRNPGVNASVQFAVGYSWWK